MLVLGGCGLKGMAGIDHDVEVEDQDVSYPLEVDYCGVCGMPPEYCEYSPTQARCYEWMKVHLPNYYSQLVEKSDQLDKLTLSEGKKQSRGGKALKKPKKKEVVRSIKISQQLRSKKKHVTVVNGLKTCDIDLKKASKQFATHFSCGSSVTGEDEIVIQGDISDDLIDFLLEQWPDIEEDCIHLIKDKKR